MHGFIDGNMYVKKEFEKHKLRMGGKEKLSWTINLDEINNKDVKQIVYFTEKTIYRISYDKAHQKGFIKKLGGENKLVVPIKYWIQEEK
jgi:hypothetical protein